MSVTVKVFCQLAVVFLVVFLDQSVAKQQYEPEPDIPKTIYVYSDYPHSEDEADFDKVVKYNTKSKTECTKSECPEDFEKQHEYDKEQYWNKDEYQIEEPTGELDTDIVDEEVKPKVIKRSTDNIRHKNHRYDDEDSIAEESRRTPKRQQYEVYEIQDEQVQPTEDKFYIRSSPPDIFVYKGVEYMRVPETSRTPKIKRTSDSVDRAETEKIKGHKYVIKTGDDQLTKRDAVRGDKKDKSYKVNHQYEKGVSGKDVKEKRVKQYNEQGGKMQNEREGNSGYGEHLEAAEGQKGAKFDEKKAHKKGHNTKGYHNKYQKDEYHKEHKFYDDHHKSGSHSRYGDANTKYSSKDGGYQKKGHYDSSSREDNSGKKGQYAKGYKDEGQKSYKNEKGYEKYNGHHSDRGSKGGDLDGTKYVYHKF